jgi:Cu2+-exporting ATPase
LTGYFRHYAPPETQGHFLMLQILAISSAIALGSTLTFGRKSRTLKRKRFPHRYIKTAPQPDTQKLSTGAADKTRGKNQYTRAVKQGRSSSQQSHNLYRDAKNRFHTIRKVVAISMGGTQDRDEQITRLAAQHGKGDLNATDLKLDRRINISVGLMGLAAAGSFFYSPLLRVAGVATLFNNLPVFQELSKNLRKGRITTELLEIVSQISLLVTGYYFLATFVCFVALLDLKLLRRTEEQSHKQLIDQFSQKSHTVWVFVDGAEVEMPLEAVRKNDFVVVNTGEVIPVDGIVVEGIATVDQQSLTGEAQPVEKEDGATVFATTLVLSGRILIQAERTGSDTNAAQIGHILEQTQDFKEGLRLRGKKIADGFIAPTLFVSSLTLPILGPSSALAILWSGFGYDMKLYGPISVLNFLHLMAKNGILIKDGRSLETLQKLDTVVFDKTGTLTVEQPKLERIYLFASYDEETLLTYAAAAEHRQSHPVGKAILSAAEQRGLTLPDIEDAAYQVGYGIQVKLDDKLIQVGSARFMEQRGVHLPAEEVIAMQNEAHDTGSSLVYVAVNGRLAGVLRLDPCVRPEAKRIVEYLRAKGITVSIISGDQKEPTRRLAHELGVDSYYAEVLPAQKARLIAELRADGRHVGYVGDGINDAIALKGADVSISLSGASTVATDTAQIILMDGDLARIESLFEISSEFEKNMNTNYKLSMIPGVITLTGVFTLHMGIIGALFVYFTSEIIALTNCMMPLIKDEISEDGATWKVKSDTGNTPLEMACDTGDSELSSEVTPDKA